MADAVTSQTLLDGERLVIQKFTNVSDGTGESAVVKVDVSTLSSNAAGQPCTGVKINKIWSTAHGMAVNILWDATTDVLAWVIPPDTNYHMDFSTFGGVTNNAGAGKTGDIAFTTVGNSPGESYAIVLECIKTYG